jgi:hypothetical protein
LKFAAKFPDTGVNRMLRAILAVIVSYVLMFVLIFLAFTCAYYILGGEGSFKPGSLLPIDG